VLGKRGSGKTTTASVFAEELLKAGFPIVIVDPTDAWWGLRSSKDGRAAGFPITILGGDHGDAPLEETAGKVIADLVAEEAPPLVLSLAALSKSAGRRFAADFFERLYERNRTALAVIVDEADEFAPQRIPKGGERLFGAIDQVVRRGRIRGLGVVLVSQRSAAINKDVLSQCEVVIAHRASHPRDLDPILEWMQVHATKAQLAEVHGTIAQLADGEAWVMSPEWLDFFGRVQIRDRETFNSSATPKAGQRRIAPKRLAPVDLRALQDRMAETIERAKAADPALLRRRIAELERDLARKPAAARAPAKERRVEIPVVRGAELKRLEVLTERLLHAQDRLAQAQQVVVSEVGTLANRILALNQRAGAPPPAAPRQALQLDAAAFLKATTGPARRGTPALAPARARGNSAPAGEEPGPPRKGELRILTAAAQYVEGVTREQLTVLTGYRRSSRDTYLQRLGARGLVEAGGDQIRATPSGVAALGPGFEPLPTGSELLEHWRVALPGGERAILEVLIAAYPEALHRDQVAERAPQYRRSSRDTYLQRLRSRRLVTEEGRGQVRASDMLFQATVAEG
jgi:hypothetical protein